MLITRYNPLYANRRNFLFSFCCMMFPFILCGQGSYSEKLLFSPFEKSQVDGQLDRLQSQPTDLLPVELVIDGVKTIENYERIYPLNQNTKLSLSSQRNCDVKMPIFYRDKKNIVGSNYGTLTLSGQEYTGMIAREGWSTSYSSDTSTSEISHANLSLQRYLPNCESPEDLSSFIPVKRPVHKTGTPNLELFVYLEIDHYTYLDFNQNNQDIINWIGIIMNDVSALYALHNVDLVVSEIFIWDTPTDPYAGQNLSETLAQLGIRLKNSFNGDISQVITTERKGGGRANINGLCQPYNPADHSGPYSMSAGLSKSLTSFPDYSWNVFVIAHEMGHVLGSRHTHACVWGPNNDRALDDCYGTEGGCSRGAYPFDGGTIMSYCYLDAVGINFANGFGTEPGDLIYSTIYNADCLLSNSCVVNTPCDDGNPCTMYDQYDADCHCNGTLIDVNSNNVCDLTESCPDEVNISNTDQISSSAALARIKVSSTASTTNSSTLYSAGSSIELNPGFEVLASSSFEAMIMGCNTMNQ